MTKQQFKEAEKVMLQNTEENVHDEGHVYRVLYAALRIAEAEPAADLDVVVLSALLHDIGRAKAKESGEDHAQAGAKMAYAAIIGLGWSKTTASRVRSCILTHSYKGDEKPQTLEAKILYDADKLDLTGAVGTARALVFGARINEPLYALDKKGMPKKATGKGKKSLMREYERKLKHMPSIFFTKKGRQMAKKRQKAMDAYFAAMKNEVNKNYKKGTRLLDDMLV